METEIESRTANSTYKKLAVQCLNEALCFVSSSVLADSLVLQNRQLLVAAKRWQKCFKPTLHKSKLNMRIISLIFTISILFSCSSQKNAQNNKIKVLNFATIHLSNSSDRYTSTFDLKSDKTKKEIKKIVDNLVKFQPTIVCLEIVPEEDSLTNISFQNYIKNQNNKTNYSKEIDLIGFEVARLSGVKKIYGIDNHIGFDYPKLIDIAQTKTSWNAEVSKTLKKYENLSKLPMLEQYKKFNDNDTKEQSINDYNYLATIHTKNNFEGADIISEFYKRNLRMYSNFNDIPMNSNDRVLIIMGGTHTAYFDFFIQTDNRFELINIKKYLKLK